jgi:GNAT superfamily N-acetyltransferase
VLEQQGSLSEIDPNIIEIDIASPEDTEAICEVQRESWLATYPNDEFGITQDDIRLYLRDSEVEGANRYRRSIESQGPDRAVFVAKVSGRVLGYAISAIEKQRHKISEIYVDPDLQGKGVGSRLLERAIAWHGRDEDIFLWVVEYNQKAQDFYQRYGFQSARDEVADGIIDLSAGKKIRAVGMVLPAASEP